MVLSWGFVCSVLIYIAANDDAFEGPCNKVGDYGTDLSTTGCSPVVVYLLRLWPKIADTLTACRT